MSPEAYDKPHLTGASDILAQHGLSQLYDIHVRAYLPPQPPATGSPALEARNLRLVFRTDATGRVASVGKTGEPREMEPTYLHYLPDIICESTTLRQQLLDFGF